MSTKFQSLVNIMRTVNTVFNEIAESVHHALVYGMSGSQNFPFKELNECSELEFKTLSDSSGMASKIASSLIQNWNSNSWLDKMDWVQEILILVFVLWPIGVLKEGVLAGVMLISDSAMQSNKLQVAVFMIKKVIQGMGETQLGTKTDIGSLRLVYPRISWYANEVVKRMDQRLDWKTCWADIMNRNPFAPSIMLVLKNEDFDILIRCWEVSNLKETGRTVLYNKSYVREMANFANRVYLGDESKWISKELKIKVNNAFFSDRVTDNSILSLKFSEETLSVAKVSESHMESTFSLFSSSVCSSLAAFPDGITPKPVLEQDDVTPLFSEWS